MTLIVLALGTPTVVEAQAWPRAVVAQRAEQAPELFNWYYASVYGTGVYKVGEETVGVVRVPLGYRLREMTNEQWGLRLTFPVAAAVANFDLTDFDLGRIQVRGLSVMPGIEAEIPVRPGWVVKPFASAGGGREFGGDDAAFIWAVGASALYQRSLGDDWLLGLGGKLTYAGYSSGDVDNALGAVSIGGELGYPVAFQIFDRQALLGAQLVGTWYFESLDFLLPGSPTREVSYEVEVALTIGVRVPVEILGAQFDRIGLGYRQGSDGLKGVRLVASFPF